MKKNLFLILAALALGTGLTSCGEDGHTPYIGDNGNWWINSSDLGVPAQGQDGSNGRDGSDGQNGSDGKDGVDGKDGSDGQNGSDGVGVTVVSVEKTGSDGPVDTYTITFSDGTTSTFTVTNGQIIDITSVEKTSTEGLVDTYTITFSNGSTYSFSVTNGKDGADPATIVSVEHTSTEGLIDAYTITYSDGSKTTFAVTNGEDGESPYIGENGNWWVGDTDTGVLADYDKANDVPLTELSDGLVYTTMTVEGKTGFVVTDWSGDLFSSMHGRDPDSDHLVIPNYIGSIPVIGVQSLGDDGLSAKAKTITLSENTVYLGTGAFGGTYWATTSFDFHGAKIKSIPAACFAGFSEVEFHNIPNGIERIGESAFYNIKNLDHFDFSKTTYIGQYAFVSWQTDYVYLPKTVETVGSAAFASTYVYTEHETKPDTWADQIGSSNDEYGVLTTNCKISGDYLYSVKDGVASLHKYLGTSKKITLPSSIGGYAVKSVGYGFNSAVNMDIDEDDYAKLASLMRLEEITIPEGVTSIDYGALLCIGTMIKAPKSLVTVDEEFIEWLEGGADYCVSFLALAGTDMPTVMDCGHVEDVTKEEVEASTTRVAFGVDFTKLANDGMFYYLDNGASYSLFAYMGLKGENLKVPATYNSKPVSIIGSKAFGLDPTLKSIDISEGVTRIRAYAFTCHINLPLEWIRIPTSVEIFNANGIYCNGESMYENHVSIYVAANSKPVDWDSNWTDAPNYVSYGIVGEIKSNAYFYYLKGSTSVGLLKHLGTSLNVYIPSTLDGLPVTKIHNGFYGSDYGAFVFIPASIITIESKAFVNRGGYTYNFYCYASSTPSGWADNWYYRASSGSVSKNWNQTSRFDYAYSGEYVYRVEDDTVTLLAHQGNMAEIRVPRKLNGKTVASIDCYCFEFTGGGSIYIPQEVTTILGYGLDCALAGSNTIDVYCEPTSRPSGWNSYFANNSRGSGSCFSVHYGAELGY